jgi:hypothetical protein
LLVWSEQTEQMEPFVTGKALLAVVVVAAGDR